MLKAQVDLLWRGRHVVKVVDLSLQHSFGYRYFGILYVLLLYPAVIPGRLDWPIRVLCLI